LILKIKIIANLDEDIDIKKKSKAKKPSQFLPSIKVNKQTQINFQLKIALANSFF